MARAALAFLTVLGLVVLSSFASSPPNLEKTLAAQQELVRQQPYDPQAHNDLGNLLVLAGRETEAEQAYQRAIELDPRASAVRFNLAVLYQQNGRTEEAQNELQRLLEVDPYHAWGQYQLGQLFEQRRDRSKAIEHYARAFAYDPALTFSVNNPHIIDNALITEALIQAQRYRDSPAARVPRQYSDPQRIAEMMLALESAAAEEAESPQDQASEKTGKVRRKGSASRPGLEAEGETRSPPRRRRGAENDDAEDEEEGAGGGRVVLTPGSIDQSQTRRNQATVQPPRPGSREARREAFAKRFESRFGDPGDPGGQAPPGSDRSEAPTSTGATPRRRYIPGHASTGRLELELLDAEPAERYAGLLQPRV